MRPLPPARLLGDGFIVRPWRRDDVVALNAAVNASLPHLRPWMPWAQEPNDLATTELVVRRNIADYHLDKDFVLGILGPDDTTVLGGTGFHPRGGFLGLDVTEIGMWIHADQAGQGLGTRVLAALLPWALTDWWWQRVEWRCDDTNLASARVAEKAGMTLEGVLRNNLVGMDGTRRSSRVYAAIREG